MSRRLMIAVLALAAGALAGAPATGAKAYVAAKVDEQIRPNFGILLKPPLHRHRHGAWRGRRYGYSDGYRGNGYGNGNGNGNGYDNGGGGGGGGYGGQTSITVDCADPFPQGSITDAARYVADGGIVYVRARGVACKETVLIEHPVIIAAEETPAFSTDPAPSPVIISPPDGAPCALIAQGVKEVEFRGLTFQADHGADTSCIQGWDVEVALVNDSISYSGDASAVYVSGGKLIMRSTRVDAHTYDAAILAEGSKIDLYRVRVRADAIGLDLTLGPEESKIDRIGVRDAKGGGAGSIGIAVRAERSGGSLLRINNSVVCGFRAGITTERASRVEINRTRVCRSSFGVVGNDSDLGVTESTIGADRVGIYAFAGQLRALRNRIWGPQDVRDFIVVEAGGGAVVEPNWYFVQPDCKKFEWDKHHYCKDYATVPAGWRDEAAFDRDHRDGWDVDGYDEGYTKEGAVAPFDKPKPPVPPKKQYCVLFCRVK